MEDVLIKIKDTGYEKYFENKDMVSVEELLNALEKAIDDKETINQEYKEFKQEVEDNYKPITYAEQIGHNEKDFY